MTVSLRQQLVRGSYWSVGLSYFQFAFNFAANIVIARSLGPAPYGPFVMLTSLQSAICLFLIVPISMVYIRSEGTQTDFDAAWIASTLTGALCLLAAASGFFFYRLKGDLTSGIMLAILCAVQMPLLLSTLYLATFEKALQFKTSLLISTVCTVFCVIVAVILAWRRFGIWALLVREAAPGFLIFFVARFFSPVHFERSAGWRGARSVLHESFKFWTSRSTEQLFFRVPFLAIGAYWGKDYLSRLSQAFYLAQLPSTALSPLTQTVAFPAYSALDRHQEKLLRAFRASIFILLRMSALIAGGFFLLGDHAIHLLYGSKWTAAEPLVVRFWLFAAVAPFFSNVRAAAYGRGKQSWVTGAYGVATAMLTILLLADPHTAQTQLWVPYILGCSLLLGTLYCFYRALRGRVQAVLQGVMTQRFFLGLCLLITAMCGKGWLNAADAFVSWGVPCVTLAIVGILVSNECLSRVHE